VAASRGHEVHLFEKASVLGGQLIMGSVTNYKKELLNLIRYQKRQIEKFGVKCHLNQEVTVDTIEQQNPDVVILATGSLPVLPPVEGIDKPIVTSYVGMLEGETPSPKKTVVIGGGATGCEVAHHLAESGSDVTIVELLPKIGKALESMTRKILLRKLRATNTGMMTETSLKKVEDNGVVVSDKDGNETFLEAQRVVIAIGSRPDNHLYEQVEPLGYELHRVGDCLEPRSAKAAIYEGGVLGRSI
jgi:2-enoate reductase